jgi:hypothetical protein
MEALLDPPESKRDVAHCLNALLAEQAPSWACINCSIEESTLAARSAGLLPQDAFLRDALKPRDVLVICLGGNDVVLAPTLCTMAALGSLLSCASEAGLRDGSAVGMAHLVGLFLGQMQAVLGQLTEKATPALVIPCFVYFPQEHSKEGGDKGWADGALSTMGYNSNPGRLQAVMRAVFQHSLCKLQLPGCKVAPLAFFELLDCSPESKDYCQRVEPSERGGEKIAAALLATVLSHVSE